MTLVRPCPTCGRSGKDKDGNRCLECGGADRALPDFANRFSVKSVLVEVESRLRNQLECHLPPPETLDADDVGALDVLLQSIRGLATRIHDRLVLPSEPKKGDKR